MVRVILSAIVSFAATNFDEIFILSAFFGRCDSHREERDISIGHLSGMVILTGLSILTALGWRLLPTQYIHLLGIFPIALAAWEIFKYIRGRIHPETVHKKVKSILPDVGLAAQIMIMSLVHGLDNIGIYAAMFVRYNALEIAVTAVVFAVMTELWCMLSEKLVHFRTLHDFLHKHAFWLIPLIYLYLGLHVLMH
ncbi:MAG: cadmium resistance transporter [Clostridia bacterium]|nr:cadmium resistance transporter [Clostridia bacterium]